MVEIHVARQSPLTQVVPRQLRCGKVRLRVHLNAALNALSDVVWWWTSPCISQTCIAQAIWSRAISPEFSAWSHRTRGI